MRRDTTATRFWRRRSVFVTGASGFLGGWLTKYLVEAEANVVALVRDETPHSMLFREGLDKKVACVRGDLSDLPLLARVLAEYEVKTVFHLAAQAIVGVAKKDPVGTLESNVRGTWNLLEAARRSEVEQIVAASSDKAYGDSQDLPYEETHSLRGAYPYDVSKSCADLICQMYHRTYDLPVSITRCGNLFGGGDLNFSRTIPGVIRSTWQGERFEIRSDGKYVRDFLYIQDAVLGYAILAERMASEPSLAGEAFNLSLGKRTTVLDVVRRVLDIMGRSDLEPVILNVAKNEIREQYLRAEKAERLLGWKPLYGMDGGLRETIRWYEAFLENQAPAPAFSS